MVLFKENNKTILFINNFYSFWLGAQWAKSPKKQSARVSFCYFSTENTMPCCQKYTFSAILPTG